MAEFKGLIADEPSTENWFGHLNFTLAAFVDCKWHRYRYCIHIKEEDKRAVWCSIEPPPVKKEETPSKSRDKPPDSKPAEKDPEPKLSEENPADGGKPKIKIGWNKDPPPPPKNCVVDDFSYYSATRLLPTAAKIRIIDPLSRPKRAVYAEVTFLRWLHGAPPRMVFLRPSRFYSLYRFQDFSFWMPPPPPPPPRKRLRVGNH